MGARESHLRDAHRIEDAELVLPSLCWDELEEEADDIMFAALDPEMDERFATVTEFAEALTPLLGNPKKGKKVLADIVRRDELDSARETSPLVAAADAKCIDSTGFTIDEIIEQICDMARAAGANA